VPLLPLAALFALIALACAALLVRHAFGRSVGTGLLVLLLPAYVLVYAFGQFEHRRKGLIVAGFVACGVLAALLLGVGSAQVQASLPPPPPRF
jgi:translocator protein